MMARIMTVIVMETNQSEMQSTTLKFYKNRLINKKLMPNENLEVQVLVTCLKT